MKVHADQAPESQEASHNFSKQQSHGKSVFSPAGHQPKAFAQGDLQERANNSPRVKQLMAFQAQVNHSPQAQKAIQLQAMAHQHAASKIVQRKENNTGLPDQLRSGIETLSGHSMNDVKVHYNSDKPAQLNAHAYAQGTDIHLAPGQEKHLPHEAWHVVQQKQGRVKATKQFAGADINDDKGLEKEADRMGTKAMQLQADEKAAKLTHSPAAGAVVQRIKIPEDAATWNSKSADEPEWMEPYMKYGGSRIYHMKEIETDDIKGIHLLHFAEYIDEQVINFTDVELKEAVIRHLNDRLDFRPPAVKRVREGAPEKDRPFIETRLDDSKAQSFGMTMGHTIELAVPGFTPDKALTARITQGDGVIWIGASSDSVDATEVDLERNEETHVAALFVKSQVLTEEPGACTIEVKEDGKRVSEITPKIYKELEVKLKFWSVTFAGEEGMEVPEDTVDKIMPQIEAIWTNAGIKPTLAEEGKERVTINRGGVKRDREKIYKELKKNTKLKAAVSGSIKDEVVNIILLPSYVKHGQTYTPYTRKVPQSTEMIGHVDKTLRKGVMDKGLGHPVIFVTVGLTETLDKMSKQPISITRFDDDNDEFATRSLALDVAHELGHFLSLAHPVQNVVPPAFRQKIPTALFHQLMHTQIQYDTRTVRTAAYLPDIGTGPATYGKGSEEVREEVKLRGGLLTASEAAEAREFLEKWKSGELTD